MIPELTREGMLPPGIHETTLEEVRRRFGGGNRARIELMKGLSAVATLARRAGAGPLYLDGSFVTSKREPLDWDAVLVVPTAFDPSSKAGVALSDREAIRAEHGGDLFVIFEDDTEELDHMVGRVFSRDRGLTEKGVLLIRLTGRKGRHGTDQG